MNELTMKLRASADLSRDDVAAATSALLDDGIGEDAKADFLTALAQKGETAEEIAAFAMELRARAVDPRISGDLLDVVGTGADMAHTFNISSCVIFIAAAAGVRVAKHGNRAITSKCGSADVLAALGADIEISPDAARRCLVETGLTFFFAPLYHPSFKKIAPVRKKLAERKQRTIFNILGPLVNPARPTHQVIGVCDRALVEKYAEVLRLLDLKHAMVVHGDGLDEFTTLGSNHVAELWGGRVEVSEKTFPYRPSDIQISAPTLRHLEGADPATNAQIIRNILAGGDRGPKRDIVLLNAAAALVTAEQAPDFPSGWALAAQLIDGGAARAKLESFVAATKRA
ncbi:MAG: anthranilate phosphoribosyltransferase [Verrucomicrobia bacterium]|nr:anthranilate phosphoribosyltransferase [Verrucomicrobiota bacterium]